MTDDEVQEHDDVKERDDRKERDDVKERDEVQTDDDVDGEETTAGTRLTCVACGSAIDPTEWHPVRSRIDAAGDLHIDAFCSAECRETVQSE